MVWFARDSATATKATSWGGRCRRSSSSRDIEEIEIDARALSRNSTGVLAMKSPGASNASTRGAPSIHSFCANRLRRASASRCSRRRAARDPRNCSTVDRSISALASSGSSARRCLQGLREGRERLRRGWRGGSGRRGRSDCGSTETTADLTAAGVAAAGVADIEDAPGIARGIAPRLAWRAAPILPLGLAPGWRRRARARDAASPSAGVRITRLAECGLNSEE